MIKYIIIFIYFYSFRLYSQEIQEFSGVLAYEYSLNNVAEDDMIYRGRWLVSYDNCAIDYKKGIFIFEDIISKDWAETVGKEIYEWGTYTGEIHVHLDTLNTKEIKADYEVTYKLFSFKQVKLIYLGKYPIRHKVNNKFILKPIPVYYIINFNYIDPFDGSCGIEE